MGWAACLLLLKLAIEGFNLQLWTIVDCTAATFFYWLLLSANLLAETLYELRLEATGNRICHPIINVDPVNALMYLYNNITPIALNILLK